MPLNGVYCILLLILRKIYKDRGVSAEQLADFE